jgi:hypothetical protein
MVHESIRIIRDEHAALAAMLKSMGLMIDRGPTDNADGFF